MFENFIQDPKDKIKEEENERIIDYNPDDMEFGEELPGLDKKRKKSFEKNRDLSPDDFE
ncbi:MAG: hypothetical protein ACQERJ_06895 [Bacillota bacterium]